MSDPNYAEIQREQRRVSDELSAMRSMHIELMKGVGDMCTQLKVLDVLYRQSIGAQSDMAATLKEHGDKIEAMRISQAGNEYFISLVKTINRNVVLAMLAAIGGGGSAIASLLGG